MVDSSRQFRSARPYTPLGSNGALPQLPAPQIQPPELPQVQDRTPELLQQTQQAVERGYQFQAQALDTAAQAGAAQAANRTRSNTGQAFGAALNAIGSGLLLYADLEEKKKVRLAQQQAAEADAEAKAREAQVEAIKNELRIEIESRADELFSTLGNAAQLEGSVTTFRQWMSSVRADETLPQEAKAWALQTGYDYIRQAQRTTGERTFQQFQELQSNQLDISATNLRGQVAQVLQGLNDPRNDPNQVIYQAESIIAGNLAGLDFDTVAFLYNSVDDLVADELLKRGLSDQEHQLRSRRRDEYFSQYHNIQARNAGNQEQMLFELAALNEEYSDVSIDYTPPTQLDQLQANRLLREEQESLGRDLLNNIPEARQYHEVAGGVLATQWLINPGQYAGEISRARSSDNPIDQQAIALYEAAESAREELLSTNTRLREIPVEQANLRAQIEQIHDRLAPGERLGPPAVTDTWTREVWINQAMAAVERGSISDETAAAQIRALASQASALDSEFVQLQSQRATLAQSVMVGGVSLLERSTLGQTLVRLQSQADELLPAYNDAINQAVQERQQQSQVSPTNFSPGAGVSAPPSVPLAVENGTMFPIQADHIGAYRFTSYYKEWRGNRHHWGIDIAPVDNRDMGARTIAGGQVIRASGGDNGRFGGLVAVRTPDGFVEQFNHLRDIHVEVGQVIEPGGSVGLIGGGSGDRWPGRSSGRHLDFMVYRPGTPDDRIATGGYAETTINPLDYMRTRGQQYVSATSYGRAPNQDIPGSSSTTNRNVQFNNGAYGQNGASQQAIRRGSGIGGTGFENSANPRVPSTLSSQRNAYREGAVKNDGEANHGYQALRENRDLRLALHQTASRLGIPSVWLADLIAYETANSWDGGITNGIGCTGLQFCPTGELRQVVWDLGLAPEGTNPTARQFDQARAALEQEGIIGQLKRLEAYFIRYGNDGRDITSIRHLYAGWNGGPNGIRNPNSIGCDSPQCRQAVARGMSPIDYHISQIGKFTGRRYDLQSSTRGADYGHTHTSPVAGCPLCREQMQRFNRVMPHIGEIA